MDTGRIRFMSCSPHLKFSVLMSLLEKQKNKTRDENYIPGWEAQLRDKPAPDALYCHLLKTNIRMCNFASCTFYSMCRNM